MNIAICVLCPYGLDQGLVVKATELADGHPVRVLIPATELEAAMSCCAKR